MAFFDDLGKKISQAGQSAVQKTKDMTEIAKYNSEISDAERKIAGLYSEIGILYAKLHRDNPEEQFAPMIKAITEAESRIAECREQIKDIKGITVCANCGAQVTGSAFCSVCGTPVPVQEKPAGAFCKNCGSPLADGSAFCTSCGTRRE